MATTKAIFGMPDYDRYLEHRRACHPGAPILSRKEYYAEYVQHRYGSGTGRCC